MESQNVFLTKSFWGPVVTYLVSTYVSTEIGLDPEDTQAVSGGLTLVVIALIRRFTERPSYFITKPKGESDE
jgi:hypothetical protein